MDNVFNYEELQELEARISKSPSLQALKTQEPEPTEDITLDQLEEVAELKQKAIKKYQRKNYIDALKFLEDAVKILPEDLEILYYEALCLIQLNNHERALIIIRQIKEWDENNVLPALDKITAFLLLKTENYQEARKILQYAIDGNPFDTHLLNMLAYSYEKEKNYREAEHVLNQILKMDPKDANACNSMAYIYYIQNKDIHKAVDFSRAALKKEPNNPAYLDTFGMLLYKQGKVDAAKKALKKAYSLNPKSAEINEHIQYLSNVRRHHYSGS